MRLRRGFLFWGLFLIPLGGLPLLVQGGYLQPDSFADMWRWWPLVLVGLGLVLLVGRRSPDLVGAAAIGLALGVLGGAALASGMPWAGAETECAGPGGTMNGADDAGTLSGDGTVTLDLDCGELDLTTEAGSAWRFHAAYRGAAPRVDAGASSLAVRAPDEPGLQRQEWALTVGTDAFRELDMRLNASASEATLDGAQLARVRSELHAGDLVIDAVAASVARLDVTVNAGRLRVTLGGGPTSGELSVNAGAIELCVPSDASLRFEVNDQLTFATNLKDRGLTQEGATWTRAGSGALIDVEVDGSAANFTLDPEGGCT